MSKEAKQAKKARDDAPTRTEMAELYRKCKNFKETALMQILSRTSLRKGEFMHMKRHWIDWKEEEIQVPAQQRCRNNCQTHKDSDTWTPKYEHCQRSIPFIDSKIEETLGDFFDEGTLSTMEMYSRSTVYKITKRVARRVDEQWDGTDRRPLEERVYPHSLRAFYLSRFAERGASMNALMDVAGWKDPDAAKHYIRASGRAGKKESKEIKKSTEDIVQDAV